MTNQIVIIKVQSIIYRFHYFNNKSVRRETIFGKGRFESVLCIVTLVSYNVLQGNMCALDINLGHRIFYTIISNSKLLILNPKYDNIAILRIY